MERADCRLRRRYGAGVSIESILNRLPSVRQVRVEDNVGKNRAGKSLFDAYADVCSARLAYLFVDGYHRLLLKELYGTNAWMRVEFMVCESEERDRIIRLF